MVTTPPTRPSSIGLISRLTEVAARFRVHAQETDRASLIPRAHLEELAATGLYAWTPSFEEAWRANEILAGGCGVTHFVSTQHQSAVGLLNRSPNERLRSHAAADLQSGKRFCGVCFAHLRRGGPPAVTVRREGDFLVFNGEAPWFTGWGVMDDIFLAGVLPDGRFLSVLCPVDGLEAGLPMQLCAFTASATVSLTLRDFRVEAWRELHVIDAAEMAVNDVYTTLKNAAQPLGAARAAALLLERYPGAASVIVEEADALRARAVAWQPGQKEEALAVRAGCNFLAVRAAQAAVVASGGAANGLDHPAQRLAREAMFYGLPQLTADLKSAQIEVLITGRSG